MILKQVNQYFILIVKELITKVPMKYVLLCWIILKNILAMMPKNCTSFQKVVQAKIGIMVRVLLSLVAELGSNINEIQYYIPKRGHSFLPNDRMFGTAKRHIRKNDRIYTPTEYENLIAGANENFEIRSKTEDIIDIKKWWPNHYKKLVLSVDSYGKGIPKDKKVIFVIS